MKRFSVNTFSLMGSILLLAVSLSSCDKPTKNTEQTSEKPLATSAVGQVDEQRIINAAVKEPGSWLSYGQDYKEHRFSKLTQITRENVNRLGIAWSKQIGGNRERMQGTPLVADGVMYVTNGWSVVYALDAVTGKEIWKYDPKTDRTYVRFSCCGGVVNRGTALYKGRVYVATYDGRLIAIDAATGKEVWDVDTYHPSALGRFNISGAPRAAGGKIFIGQGSSESGHRRGYVTAYDADTGEVSWRFYLVPGDPSKPFEHPELEMAAKTWGGEWWKYGGGGTAWNSLVYDEELHTLYIGVGNGAPWPRQIRSPGGGDDLFLTAIVAVDVDTGKMKWYYQTAPGDNWDYSAAMDIVLADMTVDGKDRKVLLQAPKNGFFYVLDREDGSLLRAHPYTEGITWASHVDMKTGRPVENPEARYEDKPQWILPANAGAHNWEPMSFDEDKGIMYFYYHDYPNFYSLDESFVKTGSYKISPVGLSLGLGFGSYRTELEAMADPRPESKGFLIAFNPLTGESKWKLQLPSVFNGGVVATTTGLVFQGDGTGVLSAYNTDSGDQLWKLGVKGSFSSSIITYMVDGTQYVASMISGNSKYGTPGTVIVLELDGIDQLPEPIEHDYTIPEQPPITASLETIDRGNALYHQYCAICHRGLGVASIVASASPDLRRMSLETHQSFSAIVLGGMKKDLGMPGFGDVLDEETVQAIRAFVSSQAKKAKKAQMKPNEIPRA